MIDALLTPLPFSNLRELCALRVENHPQPHLALSHNFTSPAPVTRQLLASLRTDSDTRNPFPFIRLLHVSLFTRGTGIRSRTALASNGFAAKSIRIRTSEKHTRNLFRIRTSKTQDLKLFRMNTYEKTGGGAPAAGYHAAVLGNSPAGYNSAQPSQELASPPPASSTLPVALRLAEHGRASAIAEDASKCIPGRQVWRVPKLST